jgi:hypothetical protein
MTADDPQFTLDDIRRHPKFPFPDWRQDDASFLMLELYWAELVRFVMGAELAHYAPLWDTERDGNPMLTITNQTAQRGLRLIMIDNDDAKPLYPDKTGLDAFYALQPFLNTGRLPDGQTPVDELVLLVSPDERYLEYFAYLIRLHCCDYVSAAQMEEAIGKYESQFGFATLPADLSED